MIRYTLLWLFVGGLIRYAWKDWCKALAILILMLAVLERPDMPKQMFGIQGLNPFNVALAGILVAWVATHRRDRHAWNVPHALTILFVLYMVVMIISTARLLRDPSYLVITQTPVFQAQSMRAIIADNLVNTFKWVIPGLLLVYGCRGEDRQKWLIAAVIGMYAVLAVLVIRQMPLGYLLDGQALQKRAAEVLQRRVGYHRVDLAMMFAGASWAMLAARPLFTSALMRAGLVGLSGVTLLGLTLTGGRTGYVAWCAVGLTLSVLKWRRNLLLMPALLICVLVIAPGIPQRMLQGFSGGERDEQTITAGRNLIWPFVLRKIGEGPLVGFGRQAWVRTNLRMETTSITGEGLGHPHNAYLEFTLDNGLIGLAVLLPFYGLIVWNLIRMFRDRERPIVAVAGGMALAATLAYLIGALGAQTFYPRESSVPMYCLIALAIRVAADAKRTGVAMPAPAQATLAARLPPRAAIGGPRPRAAVRPDHWPKAHHRADPLALPQRRR